MSKEKKARILDIVDFQHGFVVEGSDLPVPNAEETIAPAQNFLDNLPRNAFAAALFKYDTHFSGEYAHSPESQSFPNIHCEWGTQGWQLLLDTTALNNKTTVYYMAKNTFDMWDKSPVDIEKITFKSDKERAVYENLYHFTQDPLCVKKGLHRSSFFENFKRLYGKFYREIEVVMFGHASDFCVHDAIKGYLDLGMNVVVLEDLCRGIGLGEAANDMGRAPTGHIRDVATLPIFKAAYESGRLRILTSEEYMAELKKEMRVTPLQKLARAFRLR